MQGGCGERKQGSTRPGAGPWAVRGLGCPAATEALCPGVRAGMLLISAYSTPGSRWAEEPPAAIRVAEGPWECGKGAGHPRDTVTCLIPPFYFRDERGSCGPLLHSGFKIQFMLSTLCCWSCIQTSPPGGFVCFVDGFEFDTAKWEPEISSCITVQGSHQMQAPSLPWIRVQALQCLGCPDAVSLLVQLPKAGPHHLRMDARSLLKA